MATTSLKLNRTITHHRFYVNSCESGPEIDILDHSYVNSRPSSSSAIGSSTKTVSIDTNSFFNVLRRLNYLTLRLQKHGLYQTLVSALHYFFKRPHYSTRNDFYRSSSHPQLTTMSTDKENRSILETDRSNDRLYMTHNNDNQQPNTISHIFNIHKLLSQHKTSSNETVSENNNTNTLNSFDLLTTPPTIFYIGSTSSFTDKQQMIPIDIEAVSK